MIKAVISLCQFEELNTEAQNKAIQEHLNFLLMNWDDDDDYEDYEKMLCDNNYKAVMEDIVLNEYHFFISGELANVVEYTGSHEKSGQIWFDFAGEEIRIK